MALNSEDTRRLISFVKKEPRTIQDIAKHLGKSWVTADSYVSKILESSGQIRVKVFREGTQGALKLVYYNYAESVAHDEIRRNLYDKIRLGRHKFDFDPLEIYQYVPQQRKSAFLESYQDPMVSSKQRLCALLNQAESEVFCFSGNNSWMGLKEGSQLVIQAIEDALKRGVTVRVLCRVDIASVENFNKLSKLMNKYPDHLDIRHAIQPLRGWIIDSTIARLKDEKERGYYKKGELKQDTRLFYEWTDPEWVSWITQVFWNLYRPAISAKDRLNELQKIL